MIRMLQRLVIPIQVPESATSVQAAIDEINTNAVNLWERNVTIGSIYPANISDNIGIGITNPTANLDIFQDDSNEAVLKLRGNSQGTGRLYIGQSNTYGGGIVYNGDGTPSFSGGSTDHISFYRTENGVNYEVIKYKYNSDNVLFNGNIGMGDASPEAKLKIQDIETVPGVTPQISFEIESNNSSLSLGSNADWNWLHSSSGTPNLNSNKPLKLVADGVDIDYGYLNVGGTANSSTRYGVIEFERVGDWVIEDEWQTVELYDVQTGSQAKLKFPDGASSIIITSIAYDITAESSDVDENQFFEINIGGATCSVATGSIMCWRHIIWPNFERRRGWKLRCIFWSWGQRGI